MTLSVVLAGGSVLDLDGTFFVQLAIFLVALLLLRPLIFKPVMQLLDQRDLAIDGAKADAVTMEDQAQEKSAAFESELHRVHQAASQQRAEMRAEAQQAARDITHRAREAAEASAAVLERANWS